MRGSSRLIHVCIVCCIQQFETEVAERVEDVAEGSGGGSHDG